MNCRPLSQEVATPPLKGIKGIIRTYYGKNSVYETYIHMCLCGVIFFI